MKEYMIRPCGISWAYCDGNCADCPLMRMTCSDRTDKTEVFIALYGIGKITGVRTVGDDENL